MEHLKELFECIKSIPRVSPNLRLIVDGNGVFIKHAKADDLADLFLTSYLNMFKEGKKYYSCGHGYLLQPLVELARDFNTKFIVYTELDSRMGLTKLCISQDRAYAFNFCEYLTTIEGWNSLIDNVRKQLNDSIPTTAGNVKVD